MRKIQFLSISITVFLLLFLFSVSSFAKENLTSLESQYICGVYFTGIGCPHCAKTDPFLFEDVILNHPNLIIIEYEIYHSKENSNVFKQYIDSYNVPSLKQGIPSLYFGPSSSDLLVGDYYIIHNLEKYISSLKNNACSLIDGTKKAIEDINLIDLPGSPKIWHLNRVLVKISDDEWVFAWNGEGVPEKKEDRVVSSHDLSNLILSNDFISYLKKLPYTSIKNFSVALSGRKVEFQNAVSLKTPKPSTDTSSLSVLTIGKIVSLASVDSINPCALAVLTLMLLAILTYNPKSRKNILLAGGAFILAVFIMYLLYGLVIIKFFQLIKTFTLIKVYLYKILAGFAVLLGFLNIKDFIKYRPGGFLTEMPMFMRPKVKKIISGITSPKGAFVIGLFVTLFLLPCTIGPYVIAGGILSILSLFKTIPFLLLYNLIFVLPMIVIVLLIYLGASKIGEVSEWREKNIRYLHLFAGIIMTLLGIGMLIGVI